MRTLSERCTAMTESAAAVHMIRLVGADDRACPWR